MHMRHYKKIKIMSNTVIIYYSYTGNTRRIVDVMGIRYVDTNIIAKLGEGKIE